MTTSNSSLNLDGGPFQHSRYGPHPSPAPDPQHGQWLLDSPPVPRSTSRWLARSLRLLAVSLRVIFCASLMSFGLLAITADLGSYINIVRGNMPLARTFASLFLYHPEFRIRSINHENPNNAAIPTP